MKTAHPFTPPPEIMRELERQANEARFHASQIKALIDTTPKPREASGWLCLLTLSFLTGACFALAC